MSTGATIPARWRRQRSVLRFALMTGLLGWVLWEQSGSRSWESLDAFALRAECVRALITRVGVLEDASKRTTTPLVSQVYEVAASLGTMDDSRSGVFLVCLPSDADLRAR